MYMLKTIVGIIINLSYLIMTYDQICVCKRFCYKCYGHLNNKGWWLFSYLFLSEDFGARYQCI
jgi:hypothetical protein